MSRRASAIVGRSAKPVPGRSVQPRGPPRRRGHDLTTVAAPPLPPYYPPMGVLDRLFPDKIFRHRLSDSAEKRLKFAVARAEEAIIEVHVRNALLFVETLDGELSFDRAIDTYIREMAIPEPLSSTVATRTLVGLSESQSEATLSTTGGLLDDRPPLRLDEPGVGDAPGVRRIG